MREHPILFNGEMVRAILDSRKTMTRRVVKHQDCVEFDKEGAIYVHHYKCPSYCEFGCNGVGFGESPYGLRGDRLWVRETWAYNNLDTHIDYKASYPVVEISQRPWKPSIHMFRKDSRITLEIIDVRVEKLQEITDEDIAQEGICVTFHDGNIATGYVDLPKGRRHSTARYCFESLWDSINNKKYPWSSNPWVFVIEFKKA